jgi:hypothetical protein
MPRGVPRSEGRKLGSAALPAEPNPMGTIPAELLQFYGCQMPHFSSKHLISLNGSNPRLHALLAAPPAYDLLRAGKQSVITITKPVCSALRSMLWKPPRGIE